jgi:hypothetical protein
VPKDDCPRLSFLRYVLALQLPSNGVPIIPTTSSAQMSNNKATIEKIKITLDLDCLTRRIMNSIISPLLRSKAHATTKSESFQYISFVNCMAINGTSNNRIGVSRIPISLLFFASMPIRIY